MRLIAKNLLLSLCILFAGLLLLSHLFTSINPTSFSLPALLSLFFPALLIINIVFLLIWFFRRHWAIFIPIIALFFTWSQVEKMYAFQSESELTAEGIKILSYNVKNFDLYNWESNVDARNNIAKVIKSIDADVINFQEFYTRDNHELDNLKFIKQNLKLPYYHFVATHTVKDDRYFGLATFSKYPISNKGKVEIDGSKVNTIIYSDLEIGKKKLRVYNTHLQSIHFGKDDLDTVENPSVEATYEKTRSIFSKLKVAFSKRGKQADKLTIHANGSPYPTVITGDFNDTPHSYSYETIGKERKDAFLEAGKGLGYTYAGPIPGLRIDYIFTDEEIAVSNFKTIKKGKSDHYPISCYVELGE